MLVQCFLGLALGFALGRAFIRLGARALCVPDEKVPGGFAGRALVHAARAAFSLCWGLFCGPYVLG